MDVSKSGQKYLENYYILEQTRKEVHTYLEALASAFAERVEQRAFENNHPLFSITKTVQKGGGYVELNIAVRKGMKIKELDSLGEYKFYVFYKDAIRNDSFVSSTQYQINGFTPKANTKLSNEMKRVAGLLQFPNPFIEKTGEILEFDFDEMVNRITTTFNERLDRAILILEYLIKENK